ncbi:MAG: hypothetical protein V8S24_04450 [Gordonibacter pamelaeae]
MTHQYGEFTWFNADQEGNIDDTGGFWEGENYSTVKAYEGREAAQANLLKGQTQGLRAGSYALRPGHRPGLNGEFEVELKDGKKHKVRPVWEYYRERAAEFAPEIAAEITGIPAEEIIAAATAYATRIDPETGYGNGGIQYMLAIEHACNAIQNCRALDNLDGHHGQHRHPRRQPLDHDRPDRRRPPGLRRLGPRRLSAGRPRSTSSSSAARSSRFWVGGATGPTEPDLLRAMLTSEPYPVRALWNESGNFMCAFANTTTAWEGLLASTSSST